jgi:hypothetical protein
MSISQDKLDSHTHIKIRNHVTDTEATHAAHFMATSPTTYRSFGKRAPGDFSKLITFLPGRSRFVVMKNLKLTNSTFAEGTEGRGYGRQGVCGERWLPIRRPSESMRLPSFGLVPVALVDADVDVQKVAAGQIVVVNGHLLFKLVRYVHFPKDMGWVHSYHSI